ILASWSRSVTTISLRVSRVRPIARLSRRRNVVAFIPKAISSGTRALISTAMLSRARAMVGVDHALGNLCAGAVIEEDEPRLLVERRKGRADSFAGKSDGRGGNLLL